MKGYTKELLVYRIQKCHDLIKKIKKIQWYLKKPSKKKTRQCLGMLDP
jgi:hypothetical protein